MHTLGKIVGLLLILVGLWLTLTVLAFASLIDPSLQGAAWWAEYWRGMGSGQGWGSLGLSLTVIAVGGWLMVLPPKEPGETGST